MSFASILSAEYAARLSGEHREADINQLPVGAALTLVSGVGFNVGFLAYNTQPAPLNQLLVRRALDMAIDKPAIIQPIFSGNAMVATNPMPPAQWSYKELKDAP